MRRVFLLGLVVTALPSALDAQSVDEQIARAVMAAPANLQADAAVITFDESGEIVGSSGGVERAHVLGQLERAWSAGDFQRPVHE